MKRDKIILVFATLVLMFFMLISFAFSNAAFVSAADSPDILGTGLNLQDLPATPGKAGEIGLAWAEEKLNEKIMNNSFFSPIHKWGLEHPDFFKIIFGVPYGLTFVFFFAIILWLFIWAITTDAYKSFNFGKVIPASLLGLATSIILAAIGFIGFISNSLIGIIMKQEQWLLQFLFFFFIVILLIVIKVFSRNIYLYFVSLRKSKKLKEIESKAEEANEKADENSEVLDEIGGAFDEEE